MNLQHLSKINTTVTLEEVDNAILSLNEVAKMLAKLADEQSYSYGDDYIRCGQLIDTLNLTRVFLFGEKV